MLALAFAAFAISIHALLAESDLFHCLFALRYFISIHALLAESDARRPGQTAKANNFYPRSPCGERPPPAPQGKSSKKFLSTLSLRRATLISTKKGQVLSLFLSTLSLRRATLLYAMGYYRHGNFYPRSPCGERQCRSRKTGRPLLFLSTLSLRRATWSTWIASIPKDFYPRSPCGERPSVLPD